MPVLSIGHWPKLGLHLRGNIVGFEELKSPKKLLISEARTPPDVHHMCDDPAFHAREILPFYEHHLKGVRNDVMKGAAAKIFVRGADVFRTFTTWPPKPARFESWYLRKEPSDSVTSLNDGSLSRDKPAKDEGATSYTYPDPAWRNGVVAFDKGVADPVKKVLTFTSKPLEADLDIAGGIVLELVASSDQPDTDFIVKLSDQEPQSAEDAQSRPPAGVPERLERLAQSLAPPHTRQSAVDAPTGRSTATTIRSRSRRAKFTPLPSRSSPSCIAFAKATASGWKSSTAILPSPMASGSTPITSSRSEPTPSTTAPHIPRGSSCPSRPPKKRKRQPGRKFARPGRSQICRCRPICGGMEFQT